MAERKCESHDSDLVEIMAARHSLNSAQRSHGNRNSALVRAADKNAFLWAVRDGLISLAREGVLGETLRERSNQLNRLGIRTARGKLLDPTKLSPALMALGADANTIKLLLKKATDAADIFGVEVSEMVDQLWHEWLYHHTKVMVDEGLLFGVNASNPFRFEPAAPFDWAKAKHPIHRDSRVRLWWFGKHPVLPPQARLVFALFGMFGHTKKKLTASDAAHVYYFP
jgi:hypothetical protein